MPDQGVSPTGGPGVGWFSRSDYPFEQERVPAMARGKSGLKNIREMRAEAEAAEKVKAPDSEKTPAKKKAAPRKSAKAPVEIRKKLFWGVFNQSLKRVALFEFHQKNEAEKKADELSKSGKSQHFVQKVKEEVSG